MATLLSAHWTNLLTATFEADKSFLQQYVPVGTELDDWNGKYLLSLVAFMFERPSLLGIPSPFYRSFEEINLRFYVKYRQNNEMRKGVVFIKEIAPSSAIGLTAKLLYKENFISLPMKHEFKKEKHAVKTIYSCKINNEWSYLNMESRPEETKPEAQTIEYFIWNRYWGYTSAGKEKTMEFNISHQPWKIFPAFRFVMGMDIETIYGKQFDKYLKAEPLSAFLMDGGHTKVSWPLLL
ncbi:MAG: DUF2071 domain-containing protein [Chitinophagaceae bacterium]